MTQKSNNVRKTGGEIIVDYLISNGVKAVVGIPGHGCLGIFDALRDRVARREIEYIQVKQEMCAGHFADGFYRAGGKPLAVLTSIGAGAINALLGLATAYVDSTPLLLITGDAHTHMRGKGILQEFERQQDSDYLQCVRPLSKRCWRVENVAQLPQIMRRAFELMNNGRKGPVVLSVPMDVQCEELNVPEVAPGSCAVDDYPLASDNAIQAASKLIMESKRPVILMGGGVYHERESDLLVSFAERIGAAVLTTMASKSAFPETHPLYAFHGGSKGTDVGNHFARTADLVIALGCRFADESTSSYRKGITYNFPDTKLIHVDLDAHELGKNYTADVSIQAGAVQFIRQVMLALDELGDGPDRSAYAAEIQRVCQKWRSYVEDRALQERKQLTISRLLYEMRDVLPADCMVVSSSGNTQAQLLQEYVFEVPNTCVTTGGFSTMGFAVPAALGVKYLLPDKCVVALVGDGDFMMTMQEMSTAVQYNLPVIIIVANNMGWYAIKDLQIDVYGQKGAFGNDFVDPQGSPYSPDFVAAAKAFGIPGARAENAGQFRDALQAAVASQTSFLIEAVVDREYPHSGGAATGWWDVPIPTYMADEREAYLKGKDEEALF